MSDYVIKENSGTLFKNNKKDNDNAPDYTGKVNVHGHTLKIAAWVNTSKKGNKYLSLKFSEPKHKKNIF